MFWLSLTSTVNAEKEKNKKIHDRYEKLSVQSRRTESSNIRLVNTKERISNENTTLKAHIAELEIIISEIKNKKEEMEEKFLHRKISDEKITQIRALKVAGKTNRQIAKLVKVGISTVSKYTSKKK